MPGIEFRPELAHESVFIAAGAIVIGDVHLDEESSVWFNAVLRGDTEAIRIGQRTNIQDGCILHADPGFPCTIGAGVTVGHGAIVHGAVVENDVLVGMRSVLMNGARIGTGSIIGTGTVVTEGTQIPPGSLVLGIPARVVRAVTPEELDQLQLTASRYVGQAKQYRGV
ncbi:MAG TPA: gamma carbonic anhydrase family protein [Pirellulales bacterium]|nr:gamma carbonic anhydrase family protein [Pirellulales bacterium]